MKYKEGDKVLIVNHRTHTMNSHGLMDKWLGKVMTIKYVFCLDKDTTYSMVEDGHDRFSHWTWYEHDIQGKVIGNRLVVE